jgi:hypothetical protein
LQRDDIGKTIAKGLANLYTRKPDRPIKYLAEWLKSFSQNKKEMQKIYDLQSVKQHSCELYEETHSLQVKNEQ